MIFHVQNIYTYLSGVDPKLEGLVSKSCALSIPYYTKRKGQRHPYKKVKTRTYYDYSQKRFPTGLLVKIIGVLPSDNSWSIEDNRGKPSRKFDTNLILPSLPISDADYSFQDSGVSQVACCSRGLFNYPTGSGKTIVMAKIIDKLGVRTLVVVPNLQLLNQTYEKFCDYFGGDIVGKFGEGDSSGVEKNNQIVVATQQSLYSLLKNDIPTFTEVFFNRDMLFVDECHHIDFGSGWGRIKGKWVKKESGANSWWKVAMNVNAFYRYGMSATVGNDNSVSRFMLESVTGKVISSVSISELIERNVLCPIDVTLYKIPGVKCGIWRDLYVDKERVEEGAYEVNIIRNEQRNKIIASIATQLNRAGKRVLVIVDLVETHGKVLHSLINNSVFLCGKSNGKERKAGLKEVSSNGKVLIGTIFKEGFDMPEIDVLIIASGGKSDRALIQKVGRVLRVSAGKSKALVFDFYDKDGSMCERHSRQRLAVYSEEDRYKVSVEDWKGAVSERKTD